MERRGFSWRTAPVQTKVIIIGAGVAVLIAGAYVAGRQDAAPHSPAAESAASQRASSPPPEDATGPLRTVSATLVPLTQLSSGSCRTFAPEGWKITDQNKDGTTLTVASPDGSLIGAYGGLAINAGQAQGLYGQQYTSPEALAAYLIKALTHEDAQIGSAEPVGAYQAVKFTTASHAGYYLMYRFPVAADPGGYGMIFRIAIGHAGDDHSVGVAGAAAAAIRCNAVLHPSNGQVYHAPRDAHGTGNSGAGADGDLAGTYNSQLGTGWVHDRSTGQNYNVDVTTDWREDGPQGAGYYKQNGNDVTRLEPGMAPS